MTYILLKFSELLKLLKQVLPIRIVEINQWWWPKRSYVLLFRCT